MNGFDLVLGAIWLMSLITFVVVMWRYILGGRWNDSIN